MAEPLAVAAPVGSLIEDWREAAHVFPRDTAMAQAELEDARLLHVVLEVAVHDEFDDVQSELDIRRAVQKPIHIVRAHRRGDGIYESGVGICRGHGVERRPIVSRRESCKQHENGDTTLRSWMYPKSYRCTVDDACGKQRLMDAKSAANEARAGYDVYITLDAHRRYVLWTQFMSCVGGCGVRDN